MAELNVDQRYQFDKWLSKQATDAVDTDRLRDRVLESLSIAKSMTSREYTLWRTWMQVNEEFDPSDQQAKRRIQKVKHNIYRPTGPQDIETIEPELVFVQKQFPVPRVSIWGSERIAFLSNPDPLAGDWEIMRHFVSNMEHGGNLGRSVRFLVRDKPTKKYLGIICIAGDFGQLKGRDDAIGWMKTPTKNGLPDRLNNTAIGSVLVPTQPFGFSLLGGKLMALLATSRPVADMWQRLYGDVLAGVTTTSLHGSSTGGTQYNGLGKYWKSLGESPGETALRPDRVVLEALKAWMKYHHPEKYWELYEAKRENGQPLKRSANERARVFCYQKLGIDTSEFRSGHNRGIYFSRLYQNTDAFLRGEIDAADLKPKFDNSPEALTAYWRQKSRSRVQKLAEQGRFSQDTYFTDELVGMSWDDAKQRYLGHAR